MSALDHPQEELSIEAFLLKVRPRLKHLFPRFNIPPQDTEDILQQALLALLHHWPAVRDPEAWLMGTLRNKCRLYWRERKRRLYEAVDAQMLEWLSPATPPEQEDEDLKRDIDAMINRLPERCREILRLRYRLGYEPPELARELGYSPSSISKVTNRCLSALMRQLTGAGLGAKRGHHG